MTRKITKLTLIISLVLFWGLADTALGQRGASRPQPPPVQQPQPQVGASDFTIGQKKEHILSTNRHVFDESHLVNSLSDYLAQVGNVIVMSAQADLRQAFAGQDVDVTKYLERQGDANVFAIANFLNPALNDPENRMARLAIATASRAWGDYDAALRNYNDAGELFELFVVDRKPEDIGNGVSQFNNDLTIVRVPLRAEASTTSRTVAQLDRGVKVFAQEFAQGRSGLPNDEWIKVRAYPTIAPDYVEGWIHRDYVFWSPEAAEWYTPEDGLSRMYNANAQRFKGRAEELVREAEALERQAREREQRAERIRKLVEVAQRLGLPIPKEAAQITILVAEVAQLRSRASQLRAMTAHAHAADAWQQFVHWQQVGAEHRRDAKTTGDLAQHFTAARIVIDPNDLPF